MLLLQFGAPLPTSAHESFITRGNSTYVIVQGPSWEEAEANANKLGGHLAQLMMKMKINSYGEMLAKMPH